LSVQPVRSGVAQAGPRVLIADDDPTARLLVRRVLERRFRAVVREAADGAQALEACRQEAPDLLLLDISMPATDGVQVLAELRADPAFAQLPVMAITATVERATVMRMIDLGVVDYLRKPFELPAIERRLARVLKHTAQRSNE